MVGASWKNGGPERPRGGNWESPAQTPTSSRPTYYTRAQPNSPELHRPVGATGLSVSSTGVCMLGDVILGAMESLKVRGGGRGV